VTALAAAMTVGLLWPVPGAIARAHAATPGGPTGFLLFRSTADPVNHSIWYVRADGSDERELVTTHAESPQISPNGKRFAYYYSLDRTVRVRRIDGTGLGRVLMTVSEDAHIGQWSPNGSILTLTAVGGAYGSGEVVSINLRTKKVRQLTHTPSVAEGPPVWSPDGRKIMFTAPGERGCFDGFRTVRYNDLYSVNRIGRRLHDYRARKNISLDLVDSSAANGLLLVVGWQHPGTGDPSEPCDDPIVSGTWTAHPNGSHMVLRGAYIWGQAFSPDGLWWSYLQNEYLFAARLGSNDDPHLLHYDVWIADWAADPAA
jgi:hypothetical protein